MSLPVEIGLISDTHGLLRPEALEALRGVSMILHAGDVGGREILDELGRIAPVTAVRGNTDSDPWGRRLPVFETMTTGPATIFLHHGHLPAGIDFEVAGIKVVVCGHSHVPMIESKNGILHINPGSAGPRRFRLPVTIARLTIQGDACDARIVTLGE